MPTSAGARGANRLIHEKSPYLLQHAHNPVDWYPWGDEAFKKAREEGKPIFLSIGYATCHWCHVMEQESFSDAEVAALLNEKFVSIKVDREERPDIDAVYIAVATLLNGEAGWPLTLVVTPDRQPFFAGGYFPKPRLLVVLSRIAEAWTGQHESVVASAELLTKSLQQRDAGEGDALGANDIEHATRELAARFDPQNGGFLPEPKFPAAHELLFLLRSWKRTGDARTLAMVTTTLRAMRRGAIFDQIGYGFHRYATDAEWRAPHFEKTLYDQAMLTMAYTEAYQASADPEFRDTARQILEYALRDLRSPEGAFIAGEDADSSGKEGAFYRWTSEELHQATGDDFAADAFGTGALRTAMSAEELARKYEIPLESAAKRVEAARHALFVARARRVRPSRDDAVLADWNGLMIAALAEAAAVFDDPSYAAAARRAADFVLTKIRRKDGRLLHRFRGGEAAIPAMLDDYAFWVWGLLNLYESRGDVRDLESAIALEKESQRLFADTDGTFFLTASDAESLLIRPRELHDIALPSGNAAQLNNLVRLGLMTGNTDYTTGAEKLTHAAAPEVRASPSAATHLLSAVGFLLGPSFEIVLAGDKPDALRRAVFAGFVPNKVALYRPAGSSPRIVALAPFTKGQRPLRGRPTAYVCRNYQCRLPTTDPEAVKRMMSEP